MRTEIDISSDCLFQKRDQEKEAQRQELFHDEGNSERLQDYVRQQTADKPHRIRVGKPAFKPRF